MRAYVQENVVRAQDEAHVQAFFVKQVCRETYRKKKKCNKIKGLEAAGTA